MTYEPKLESVIRTRHHVDLPTARLASSALHFPSPIKGGQDTLPTNPNSLEIEFISLLRGHFGKSNIESSRPAESPTQRHHSRPASPSHQRGTLGVGFNDLLGGPCSSTYSLLR
jgi:hypothetical protein